MPQDKKMLNQLLLAKKMSDQENYVAKYNLMNKLLKDHPDEFYVDQDHPEYPGIVHAPTGFRMHLPRQATYGIEKKAQAKWRTPENLTKLINRLGLNKYFKAPALSETQAKHAVSVALNHKNADIFLHDKNELAASKFFNSVPGNPIQTSLNSTPSSSRFLFRGLKPKPDGTIPFYDGLYTGSSVTFGSPHYSVAEGYMHKGVADSAYPGLLGVYKKSPLQTYAPDYGIETALKSKRMPEVNFTGTEEKINGVPTLVNDVTARPQITLTKNPRLNERVTYETPITPEHNPLKALLLQNGLDRNEVKLIDPTDDKTIKKLVNFLKEQDKYLRYTERANNNKTPANWLKHNPRLKMLKDNYPDKFSELIRRRVNKLFFKEDPNHRLHAGGLEKIINELR